MKFPYTKSKTARIVAIISAVFLPIAVAGAAYLYYARYERKKYLKQIRRVLFLGDSQTVPNSSYADLVSSAMNWEYNKVAMVGAKTDWILDKYRERIEPYDAVIVMIGGNDVWGTGKADSAIANLSQLKSLARSRNQTLIFVSPPSKSFYSTDSTKLSEYNRIGQWMRQNGDLFVDGTSITSNPSLFASDKLHLNNQGHINIAYQFVEALRSA